MNFSKEGFLRPAMNSTEQACKLFFIVILNYIKSLCCYYVSIVYCSFYTYNDFAKIRLNIGTAKYFRTFLAK